MTAAPPSSFSPTIVASAIDQAYDDLVEQCLLEVVFEAHREHKLFNSVCQICLTKPGVDALGNDTGPTNEKFKCHNCGHSYPAGRNAAMASPSYIDSDFDEVVEKKNLAHSSYSSSPSGSKPSPTPRRPASSNGSPNVPTTRPSFAGKTRPAIAGKAPIGAFGKVPRKQLRALDSGDNPPASEATLVLVAQHSRGT
ncbi:hypothetical protein HK405_004860 [Cladochytrium tenue]|nr:hypothetical protein HK405_004860 [Cladochytrium tenue]